MLGLQHLVQVVQLRFESVASASFASFMRLDDCSISCRTGLKARTSSARPVKYAPNTLGGYSTIYAERNKASDRGWVPPAVAMRIIWHKTASTFQRYNIVCTDDVRTALEKAQKYRETEVSKKKVVRMRWTRTVISSSALGGASPVSNRYAAPKPTVGLNTPRKIDWANTCWARSAEPMPIRISAASVQ